LGKDRIWLFRGLVIIAGGLLVTAWFLPWWSCVVSEMPGVKDALVIHPYGMDSSRIEGLFHMMPKGGEEAEMPAWFTPVMWLYFGLAIAALLIGVWNKDKSIGLFGRRFNLSRLIIGIVGFSFIVVVAAFFLVTTMRLAEFDMALQGYSYVIFYWVIETGATATIRFGVWLACVAGPLLIVLALLRNKIIGKTKINA